METYKIICPACGKSDKIRTDFDFNTLWACDDCGCEFTKDDHEITLDPIDL